MNRTSIAWCDFTSNPIRAENIENGKLGWWCTKVSAGCINCYAERINRGRLGNGLLYSMIEKAKVRWTFSQHELDSWKRRTPAKIFVCDMTDLFHEDIPLWMQRRVFEQIALCPQHQFQLLTKRPRQARKVMAQLELPDLPNLWLGVTVENQQMVDARIPELLKIPAAVHFLSCEPLLEAINLEQQSDLSPMDCSAEWLEYLDWVIVGGESGPGYRTMQEEWALDLQGQCEETGTYFFFKQHSGPKPGMNPTLNGKQYHEFPEVGQ